MIIPFNDKTTEVTFGHGSTYMGQVTREAQVTGEAEVSIVLQTVKAGPIGAARDVGRPPPPGWGPDEKLDWEDGIRRVVLTFSNKEGGEQLLAFIQEALTYFDNQTDVPVTRKT